MSNPLFSTYSQGENRVTSSILAVFERISFALVEMIVQTLCQETERNLLEFRNQPKGIVSTPDAVIRASFAYWIETKIEQNAVRKSQLQAHLKALDQQRSTERQRLLVLTPDRVMPKAVKEIDDTRLAWANFDNLVEVIDSLTNSDGEWLISNRPTPTEREREMLRELVRFLIAEELVGIRDQAVVVAARIALPEYLRYSVYMCQPNRTFQPCTHLAFYTDGRIHRQIPRIIDQVESVYLYEEALNEATDLRLETRGRLLDLIRKLERDNDTFRRREQAKVVFLTAPDSADTLQLGQDIQNDLVSESGRGIPFVQGQRYVGVDRFRKQPKTTSQLIN